MPATTWPSCLNDLTDQYDPHPELFDLADETLAALSDGESVVNRVLHFELGMLRLLGHFPMLDRCAELRRGRAIERACGLRAA